jgi:small-conductance mechanosensitive channel
MLSLLISTALLLIGMLILRILSFRLIRRSIKSIESQRRWKVQIRNGLVLLFLLGFILIWGEELRTLALSVVAIAVAFVVATKELILCFTGSIFKTGARSFSIGDRIQIKDFRGDVIDQNLLATTILEIGPGKHTHQHTGRICVIPNSLFISEPIINENYTHEFVHHVFSIPLKRDENWKLIMTQLMESAMRHCQDFIFEAQKYMTEVNDQKGLDLPSVEPKISLHFPNANEVQLILRIPCPPNRRNQIEQSILRDIFEV